MCPDPNDEPERGQPGGDNGVVLAVEDEVLVRLAIADHLRTAGFTVLEAADLAEAQQVLMTRPDVQLVFSDVSMRGKPEGIELALWVRDNLPEVVVMLASGHGASLAEARARCPQVTALFDKPYDFDKVEQAIRRATRGRAAK